MDKLDTSIYGKKGEGTSVRVSVSESMFAQVILTSLPTEVNGFQEPWAHRDINSCPCVLTVYIYQVLHTLVSYLCNAIGKVLVTSFYRL